MKSLHLLENRQLIIGVYQGQTAEEPIVIGDPVLCLPQEENELFLVVGAMTVDDFNTRIQIFFHPEAASLTVQEPTYVAFIHAEVEMLNGIPISSLNILTNPDQPNPIYQLAESLFDPAATLNQLCRFPKILGAITLFGTEEEEEEEEYGLFQCSYLNRNIDLHPFDVSPQAEYLALLINIEENKKSWGEFIEDVSSSIIIDPNLVEIPINDQIATQIRTLCENNALEISSYELIEVSAQAKVIDMEVQSLVATEENSEQFIPQRESFLFFLFFMDDGIFNALKVSKLVIEGMIPDLTIQRLEEKLEQNDIIGFENLENLPEFTYSKMLYTYPCICNSETLTLMEKEIKIECSITYNTQEKQWSDVMVESCPDLSVTEDIMSLIASFQEDNSKTE